MKQILIWESTLDKIKNQDMSNVPNCLQIELMHSSLDIRLDRSRSRLIHVDKIRGFNKTKAINQHITELLRSHHVRA
jgi:hypothetical protein